MLNVPSEQELRDVVIEIPPLTLTEENASLKSAFAAPASVATEGGGVYVAAGSVLRLKDSAHLEGNAARAFGHGVRNLGEIHVRDSIRVEDGLHFDGPEHAPILDGPLSELAGLTLEGSDYLHPDNVPVTVLAGSPDYPHPTMADSHAVTLPDSFGREFTLVLDPETESTILAIRLPSYNIRYALLYGCDNPNPAGYNASMLPIQLMPPGPRTGYLFGGWKDAEGNTVTRIPEGASGDQWVVAEWLPMPKSQGVLVFRSNGPNVGGLPGPMIVELNRPVALPTGTPTRAGYAFRCWNERPDGSGARCQPGGTVVLSAFHQDYYAQWIALPAPPPPPPCDPPRECRCAEIPGNACAPLPCMPPRCPVSLPPSCC